MGSRVDTDGSRVAGKKAINLGGAAGRGQM